MEGKTVWILCLATDDGNGSFSDWDVFGVYSTKEKAEQAKKWIRLDNGLYKGVSGHTYTMCGITTRIIDYNLPEAES